MCAGPFKPSVPSAPSGPSAQEIEQQESSRRAQRDALKEEKRTASELKEQQLEITTAALAGRRGRRSLLTGRKGGGGFELSENYTSYNKGKLGA